MSTLTVTLGRDDIFPLQAFCADGVTPRDLRGRVVLFGVQLNADAPLLIGAGPGAGVLFTDPQSGKFSVRLAPAAKIGLSSLTSYLWDVLVIEANGEATTPPGLSGTLEVEDSVTPVSLAAAMPTQSNFSYHPEITALVGGGPAALNGVDVTTLSRPCIWLIRVNGQRQEWLLRQRAPGEQADDPQAVDATLLTKLLPLGADPVTCDAIWERNS